MTHTYKVTGITCNNCVSKVQKALSALDGIEKVNVTLDPPQAEIVMHHHINQEEMNTALQKAGNYKLEEMKEVIQEKSIPENSDKTSTLITYKPLIIVFLYILLGVIILQINTGKLSLMEVMNNFMGGFFLVFSFFKMLDLQSFAYSYSSYDVIAKKWLGYGYVYPFIELTLGILFILKAFPMFTNAATVIVMGISSVGVIQSIMQKRKIQCACLGTVFNLPMSTITVIEDLLMVVMSGVMLIFMF
ncbi:MAG TPA: heavy metal-associated domain-containing protein [Ignavibacteria bacterium]|nr:heavy metal-associated domain-containing protein [Ignavibacteria bacterium]